MPDNPDPQADPNWSPDGSKIVFSGTGTDPASTIRILDLATHQITTLPGSQGMYSPRWSPDGRYIPALSADSKRLLLFDFQTQKWTEVAKGTMGFLDWSKDGQYLQANDSSGTGIVIRIRLGDHMVERVVDLKNFPPWAITAVGMRSPPTIQRLCSATPECRMCTSSTGKSRNRFTIIKLRHS